MECQQIKTTLELSLSACVEDILIEDPRMTSIFKENPQQQQQRRARCEDRFP